MTAKTQDSPSDFFDTSSYASPQKTEINTLSFLKEKPTVTAMVYYEGQFDAEGSQPAKDLARFSENYKIVSFVDDVKTGKDVGKLIDGKPNEIPVYRDLGTALAQSNGLPKFLLFGKPTPNNELSPGERRLLLRALRYGINVAISLHEVLNKDPEFTAAREKKGAVIKGL